MEDNEKRELFRVDNNAKEFYFCPKGKEETVFKRFYTFASLFIFSTTLLEKYKFEKYKAGYAVHPKKVYKDFLSFFGCTASVAYRHHTAISLKIWIDPYKNLIDGIGYDRKRRAAGFVVSRVWQNEEILNEVLADDLGNISSLVAVFGKSPSQLKSIFGKSLWKSLSKNSKTRNYLLVKLVLSKERVIMGEYSKEDFYTVKETLKFLNSIPSGVLKVLNYSDLNEFKYAYEAALRGNLVYVQAEVVRGNPQEYECGKVFNDISVIFSDTRRLSRLLDLPFNSGWSLNTLRKKHDEYYKIYDEGRFSKDQYCVLKDFIGNKSYQSGEVTAKLIESPYDLNVEGREMHHCVSSYSDMVSRGGYLVYSISSPSGRSTLGVRVPVDPSGLNFKWNCYKDQVYGPCNARVSCKQTLDMVDLILRDLNEEV